MSRLERTGPPSEGGVTTASKPLKITGKNIEVEGTVENKIPESDLSLTNVVHYTGVETITGEKTFETPTPAASEVGTAGATPIKVKPGKGGEATGTGTRIGGKGASVEWELGAGATAPNAATKSTGGAGGTFKFIGGAGAPANVAGTGTNTGGKGSLFEFLGGLGGNAGGVTTGKNEGGGGSPWTFKSGVGGAASNSTTANKGGAGGNFTIETGEGGVASGEGTLTGGAGGTLSFQTGPGGTGTTTPGKGGPVRFELGKEGGSETVYGTFEIKQRGNLALFLISGEGLTTIKKGLTVEGALTLPAESITETFIKGEAVTAGKLATNAVEEAKIKEGAVTETKIGTNAVVAAKIKENAVEEAKIKAEAVTAGKIATNAVETAKIKAEAVTKEKLAKEAQEELLTVAAFPGLSAYTSAKEETETKPTFITMLVTIKGEAVLGKVKFVNDGKEVVYQWDPTITGILKQQITFLVKKGGKWKVTLEGSVEKMEIARQVLNSV